MDSSKLANDVALALARAPSQHIDRVILQLDGDRARSDCLHRIARAIADAEVPIAAFLCDPDDHRVGPPIAALALHCDDVFLHPTTHIASPEGAGPRALNALAPATVDWEVIDRELQGDLSVALKNRGADARLVGALLERPPELWAVHQAPAAAADVEWMLTAERPDHTRRQGDAADEGILHITRAESIGDAPPGSGADAAPAARTRLPADVASCLLRIRQVRDTGAILAALNLAANPLEREALQSGLDAARGQLASQTRSFDLAGASIDQALDEAEDADGRDAVDVKAAAAGRLAPDVASLQRQLADLERLTIEFPELLLEPPPGATSVGQKPSLLPTRWRTYFQSRRDDAEEWRRRVELLARPPQHP